MKNFLKKMSATLVGILIFLSTLYGLFLLFDKHETKKITQDDTKNKTFQFLDFGRDFNLNRGFLRSPGSVIRIKLTKGDHVIYDQTYKTDDGLFRVPVPQNVNANSHMIFAGCSFTWGEGLKDDETLASYFGMKDKNFQTYNLGFPGGGVNTLLRYTEKYQLKKFIRQKKGYLVFSVIQPQLNRFFGRYTYLSWADKELFHYAVENEQVVYKGQLKDLDFYKNFLKLKAAGLEKTTINTQDPMKWTDQELHEFALGLKELGKRYNKDFPEGKFIVMIHPQLGSSFNDELRKRVINAVKKLKLTVWDPSDDLMKYMEENKLTRDDFYIKDDGHPAAKTNDFLTTWIDQKIKKAD